MASRGSTGITENRPQEVMVQWRNMPIAGLNQLAPVQNTWYTVLPPSSDVMGQYFSVWITGVADVDVEARVISEGVVRDTANWNTLLGETWYIYLSATGEGLGHNATIRGMKWDFPWESRSMQCLVRTTENEALLRLRGAVRYEQL